MKLTEEQKQAIVSEESLAVIASAGTGKTTVLTERFFYLFEEKKVPLSRLLAFTFTEKASREMKQRILEHAEFSLSHFPFFPHTQCPEEKCTDKCFSRSQRSNSICRNGSLITLFSGK